MELFSRRKTVFLRENSDAFRHIGAHKNSVEFQKAARRGFKAASRK